MSYCHIFVNEDEHEGGVLSVQFQLPAITMTLAARDLLFAKRVMAFVAETRGIPRFAMRTSAAAFTVTCRRRA
jgi:hypothetical protein